MLLLFCVHRDLLGRAGANYLPSTPEEAGAHLGRLWIGPACPAQSLSPPGHPAATLLLLHLVGTHTYTRLLLFHSDITDILISFMDCTFVFHFNKRVSQLSMSCIPPLSHVLSQSVASYLLVLGCQVSPLLFLFYINFSNWNQVANLSLLHPLIPSSFYAHQHHRLSKCTKWGISLWVASLPSFLELLTNPTKNKNFSTSWQDAILKSLSDNSISRWRHKACCKFIHFCHSPIQTDLRRQT